MRQASFGKIATDELLNKINKSINYRKGKFQNQHNTPDIKEGVSYFRVMRDFFFVKEPNNIPSFTIPSTYSNLFDLNTDENILVWFGHSSYFIQVDGKKILVDPVLSGSASPISFTTKSFEGTDRYSAEDIPMIDYLFISHDHWDHLDYATVKAIEPKVGKVFCGLGVSAHLKSWGYPSEKIIEADWNEKMLSENRFEVFSVPARHFSGRSIKRNQSLWMSYVLKTPRMKIFIGGDSGYDDHFKRIGAEFGPFDWAILECGQYHEYWKYIHMMPEEVVTAAKELVVKNLLPVHWGKFSLAMHSWNDPIKRVVKEAKIQHQLVAHPMIGQVVYLSKENNFELWWELV